MTAGDFDLVTERTEQLRQLEISAEETLAAALAGVPRDVVREGAARCADSHELVPSRLGKSPSDPAPRPHALRN